MLHATDESLNSTFETDNNREKNQVRGGSTCTGLALCPRPTQESRGRFLTAASRVGPQMAVRLDQTAAIGSAPLGLDAAWVVLPPSLVLPASAPREVQ